MEAWLRAKRAKLSAKAPVGQAIDYLLKRWTALTQFLDDGRICLSNNAAERAIRPIAVGRRNWTFAGSDTGGHRAATFYTLIESAKLNGVDPQAWLADVPARLPEHHARRIDELLPWNCTKSDLIPSGADPNRWSVRTWHDRFRADGLWSEIAALLTRAVRQKRGRPAEPKTAILDSQSVVSGPQAGVRGTDGKKKVRGIKRHVLTCSRGFVLAALVTAANVHDTQAAGWLFDRAAQAGWVPERVKVDGIYTGARMDEAAARHGLDVQVSTRPPETKGFEPLPLRWRIEATFGTLTTRYRRLTRHWEQSPAAAEDAISIANCHRLLRAYHRAQDCQA